MRVKRIVADIQAPDIAPANRFYHDVLGLDVLMDHGELSVHGAEER